MNRSMQWSVVMALAWLALFAPLANAQQGGAKKVASAEGITEYHLDNGVRLLLYLDPAASNVVINMTVLVGSRHEGYGESGMAHLLEHMCFRANPNIDKMLQEHGANQTANATTWMDRTNYFETMLGTDKNLEFGIKLKADMLVNTNIKKEDLDKEMTVVRSEFEMNENDPLTILNQRVTAAAFEWHNYGKTTIGNRADIERVPVDNLRAFYRKYYQPDNVVLVIAGKFDEQKALTWVQQYFGSMKKPSRVLHETYTEEPAQDGEREVILRRVGNGSAVGVVYHVPGAAHQDFAALDVLSSILQSEPSGRIYKALVETKKATAIVIAGVSATHDPYLLEMYVQVAPNVAPEEVRDIITGVMEKMADGKVTEAEVARAKRKLLAETERKLAQPITYKVPLELTEWIAAGDWRLLFLHRDRVAKVTTQDVAEVAKKYLKRSNRTAGMFLPTKKPDRTPVPESPNIAKLVGSYKGGPKVAPGEHFDPTLEHLEKRTKRLTLPSGIKVALLPKKTRGEVVTGEIALRFGNEKSLLGKTTAANFLGALMNRGTTKHSYEQLQDELDVLGATVDVSSDAGELAVSLECKRGTLMAVLKLIHEMLRNPIFPEEDFGILQRARLQSLENGLSEPSKLASNALSRKLNPFPKDSIHYVPTIREAMDRVAKVTRNDVVKLYNEQLGANVAEVAFVGDFDEKATLKEVETMLAGWKAKTPYERIRGVVKTDVPGGKEKILTPDKENAYYFAGYKMAIDDSDKDYPALVMANYVLGASAFNSRIVDRLRTKEGLCYGASSSFRASSLDKVGGFSVSSFCNPPNMPKLEKSMGEVLDLFAKDGVTKVELDDGIKGWLQERKVSRANDSTVVGQLMSQLYLGRTYQWLMDLEKRITSLTVEQVNEAIRRHFDPSRFYIVEAGDFAKKQ